MNLIVKKEGKGTLVLVYSKKKEGKGTLVPRSFIVGYEFDHCTRYFHKLAIVSF